MIAILLTTLTISGCSWFTPKPKEVKVVTVPIQVDIAQPQMPRSIDLKEPHWYVVSNSNLEEFLARIEKEAGQVVFFAMSPADYELMAYNMQEIRRFVREMNEIIIYYRDATTIKQQEEETKSEEL